VQRRAQCGEGLCRRRCRLLMLVLLPEYQVEGIIEGVVSVLAQVREIPPLPDMEEAVRAGSINTLEGRRIDKDAAARDPAKVRMKHCYSGHRNFMICRLHIYKAS